MNIHCMIVSYLTFFTVLELQKTLQVNVVWFEILHLHISGGFFVECRRIVQGILRLDICDVMEKVARIFFLLLDTFFVRYRELVTGFSFRRFVRF